MYKPFSNTLQITKLFEILFGWPIGSDESENISHDSWPLVTGDANTTLIIPQIVNCLAMKESMVYIKALSLEQVWWPGTCY